MSSLFRGLTWALNRSVHYNGYPISAVEEGGRRFWVACVPDPSGWRLRREFGNAADAARYIDEKRAHNDAYFGRAGA